MEGSPESGWYMAQVREEKSQGFPGFLACTLTSRSTAFWGMEISKMEFSVLGRVTTRSPASSFVACLLTEMVLRSASRSVHCRAASSPSESR